MVQRQQSEIEQFIRNSTARYLNQFLNDQAVGFAVGWVTPDFPDGGFFFVGKCHDAQGRPFLYWQDGSQYPLDASTDFAIASITKTFTATWLYTKRDWGTTTLGDLPTPLSWLEGRDDIWPIQFVDLLNYTSALPEDGRQSPPPIDQPNPVPRPYLVSDMEDYLNGTTSWVVHNPGTVYTYSNLAYALAADAWRVSNDAAVTFEIDMQRNLLNPLGIAWRQNVVNPVTTFVLPTNSNDPDARDGYFVNQGVPRGYFRPDAGAARAVPVARKLSPAYHPPGGLVLSSEEMMKWLRANMNPRGIATGVISQAILRAQTKSPEVRGAPSRATSWFLGPQTSRDHLPPYYSKDGAKTGTQSYMAFTAPPALGAKSDYGVFVLSNFTIANTYHAITLGKALLAYLVGTSSPAETDLASDFVSEEIDDFVDEVDA